MKYQRFIGETDGKAVVETVQTDVADIIEANKAARLAGIGVHGDNWHVGRIPHIIFEKWLKEAGLKMSDTKAVEDMLNRKLNDGSFAAFRVKEGRI